MAFTVISKAEAGELSRDFRSITGAKRAVADDLLVQAGGVLVDDALWAGRTHKLQRERVERLITLVRDVLTYDGPTRVEFEGREWRIDHDADVPTRATVKRERTLAQRTKLLTARFAGRCGSCGCEILEGAQALYDYQERKLYCPDACATAHLAAIAPVAA